MTAGQLGRDLYTRILARFHESDLACLLTPTMRRLQRTPIPDGPLLGTSGSAWTALLFLSTPTMSGTSSSVGDRARMNPRQTIHAILLANVNSRSRSLYAIARPSVCLSSVVGNARAPYSGGSNFWQYFYGIWYPSHPLTSTENFTEIVPGEPLRRGS